MEYYRKVICVTVEELTHSDDGDPVMSRTNYDNLVKRGRLNVMRIARGLGHYALIEYASLPERFRVRFDEKFGKPEELLQEQCPGDVPVEDAEARRFYAGHTLPDGSHLPDEYIEQYTINASVLNELIRILNDRSAIRKALGPDPGGLWDSITGVVEQLRKDAGHNLPTNISRLKGKVREYQAQGYGALISGKFGNANTAKITTDVGRWIIAMKRSRTPVYSDKDIFDEFNLVVGERGWKPLKCPESITLYLSRPEIEPLWYDAVYGELAAKQRYQRKHKTILPSMRDVLWYGDGTKLNLYYKTFENKMATTQVYEVMDAYSEVLLGYHISDTEDFVAQYHALRMAVETSGHRPYEIVTDNQGGHKKLASAGFLDRITASISRRTAPYNPQSKTIESAFGRFQAQVLHKDWRFTGQNITSKRDKSRTNLEFISANQEHLYTLDELRQQYAAARDTWNNSPHPETGRPRIEMYLESVNEKAVPVDMLDMIEMFWMTTERPSLFTSSGITIQVKGKKYTYEVLDREGMPDMEFRSKHTGRQFHVMYDPLDFSMVRLYEMTASGMRYTATARPYIEIHRGIQEQEPGEMAFIRKMDTLNKQQRIERQLTAAELEMEYGVAPEQHGLNRPRLKGLNAAAVDTMMSRSPKRNHKKHTPVDIGTIEKAISNRTYDQVSGYDKF